MKSKEPEWIVNDMGELGVHVNGRFFFLYKGGNIEYEHGMHDDGAKIKYRIVGKREFGETCQPVERTRNGPLGGHHYDLELVALPGMGPIPPEAKWRDLP